MTRQSYSWLKHYGFLEFYPHILCQGQNKGHCQPPYTGCSGPHLSQWNQVEPAHKPVTTIHTALSHREPRNSSFQVLGVLVTNQCTIFLR